MNTSYEVGAVFRLVDEASPTLRLLGERMEGIEKLARNVQKALQGINEVKVGSLAGGLQGINEKLTGIRQKAEGIGTAITAGFQRADAAITEGGRKLTGYGNSFVGIEEKAKVAFEGAAGSVGTVDAAILRAAEKAAGLASEFRAVAEAARGIPRLPGIGGGGQGGGGTGGPRHGLGSHGAADRHSRIQTEHGERPNATGPHGAYLDAGIMGTIGAHEVVEAVEATLHRAIELAHVQQQMSQSNLGQDNIDTATRAAWQQARAYGLDVSKVLGDIKELVLPFGSVNHAIEFIEPLEKMRVVLNAVSEGRGNESAEAVYKMARAGELKGLNNAEEYLKYFDGMTKAISASGGKVTPNSFAQVTQYGKLASQGWSEDFYTKSLPTLMQTMNPSTAGQSLMSLFNTLISGAVSKRSFEQMSGLGLIGDESKVHYEKGQFKGLAPGAIVGSELLVKNPLEWARQFLTPLLEKKYGDLGTEANKLNAIENMGGLFGNRNSAAAIAELALRVKSFDRDKGLIEQAHGIEGADSLLKNDPTTAMNNFKAAWTNLLTALGGPSVQAATEMMNGAAGGINRLGEFVQAHPTLAKDMVGMAGGVAVGLGAIAVLGLAAFAPGGLIAVAAAALAGALGGLVAVNWGMFQKGGAIDSALTGFFTGLVGFFTGLIEKLRGIPVIGTLMAGAGGAVGGPTANANGAPLTEEQKAWMLAHPGGGIPEDMMPSILRDYRRHGEAAGPFLPGMAPRAVLPTAPTSPSGINPATPGFVPISLVTGANDNVKKTSDGFGELHERTGLINASFDGLKDQSAGLVTGFTSVGKGFEGFKNALDILTATAIGAARALAQVALSGGMTAGGGSGFMNASFGGGGSAGAPINPGTHGWWTGERQSHAVDVLMKDGISELGAKALVSRWMNVEASGGPSTVNGIGALGIGQWLGNRKNGVVLGDFDGQLHHAAHELHTTHQRALGFLNSGTALGAATGASDFERAEGYNARTGQDNFTARTLRGLGSVIHGSAPTVDGRRTVSPGKPAAPSATSASNARPIHIALHLDKKVIAKHVVKDIATAMAHPTTTGGPAGRTHYTHPGTPITDAA